MMPATLALMTEVGPPDWPTKTFPTSSAMRVEIKGLKQREGSAKRTPGGGGKRKLQQPAGTVFGGPLAALGQGPGLDHESVHLVGGRPDEPGLVGHDRLQRLLAQADASVAREAAEQVGVAVPLAQGLGGGEGVLLDGAVRRLPARAVLDRLHQDRGRGEEG